jgi:CSLREA domain-containing protein
MGIGAVDWRLTGGGRVGDDRRLGTVGEGEQLTRWRRRLGGVLVVGVAAIALSLIALEAAQAASLKISGGGFVEEESVRLSEDGQWVVFLEYDASGGSLYSVATDGSERNLLNPPLVAGGSIFIQPRVSPDSEWVVYLADQDTDDVQELYSVPIDGTGSAQKLSGPLVANGDVLSDFYITADSTRVIYTADQDTDEVREVYSVPIDGSAAPTKLNDTLASGGSVGLGQPTPDGSTVLYTADQEIDGEWGLYSVPVDGSDSATRISGSETTAEFSLGKTSPDSARVVYVAETAAGVRELFSVPVDGSSPPVTLNDPLVTGGAAWSLYEITADSSSVVYWADQDDDEVFELYSVAIDRSTAPVKLNDPLPIGGDVDSSFFLSPDSQWVVYRADQGTDEVYELYSVPVDRSAAPARLHDPLAPWGDVSFTTAIISADSTRVVFIADAETDEQSELYVSNIAGGAPASKLSGTMPAFADVSWAFDLGPTSQRVLYRADRDSDDVLELYSVPLTGGSSLKVNDPVVAVGGDVYQGVYLPGDDGRVVYAGDPVSDGLYELFITADNTGYEFVVNSTADDPDQSTADGACLTAAGTCTLRAALEQANASAGPNRVVFNLPGDSYRIQPGSGHLPLITDPIVIDGSTQPGYAGSPVVHIDGSLLASSYSGLELVTNDSTIRGLVITGFEGNGLFLRDGGNHLVEANFIGVDVTGTAAADNAGGGIVIDSTSSGNTIGGTAPGAGNVISGNVGDGIFITSADNVVEGNLIGTDASGTAAVPNGANGVEISSSSAVDNRVGGSAAGAGNVVSGNTSTGVQVIGGTRGTVIEGNLIGADATGTVPLGNGQGVLVKDASATVGGMSPEAGNVISGNLGSGVTIDVPDVGPPADLAFVQGNLIGTDASGSGPLGNGGDGIFVAPDTHFVRIGDVTDPEAANVIAHNGGRGVRVDSPGQVQILANSIFANGDLGIDRAPLGVTPNPPSDVLDGWLDLPELDGADSDAGSTTVTGFRTGPFGFEAVVQFFASESCDPSGYGEGVDYLGQVPLFDDGDGIETFIAVLPVATPAGQVITATAVAEDGSTSEFSRCEDVVAVPAGVSPEVRLLLAPGRVWVSDTRPAARRLRVVGRLDGLPSGEVATATVNLYRNGVRHETVEVPVTGRGRRGGLFVVRIPYLFSPDDAPVVNWEAEVLVGAQRSVQVAASTDVRLR